MTKSNEAEVLGLFARYDTDGNGLIDEQEFKRILEGLGEDPLNEVLSLEFAAIDTNGDGYVQAEEFVEWWLDYR